MYLHLQKNKNENFIKNQLNFVWIKNKIRIS